MKAIKEARGRAKALSKEKGIQLKKALELIAEEEGKPSWKALKDSLDTSWYLKASPFLNHWFVVYSEAKAFREAKGGYLLTYKGQYFIVQADYIEYLGMKSEAAIWKQINYDMNSVGAVDRMLEYIDSKK